MEQYTSKKITELLFSMQDTEYRDFNAKLIPTVEKKTVIGVRTPALRALAKEIHKDGGYGEFLKSLPHYYYEENNLHGMLIEKIKDFELCINALDVFLPYVDNWATCDLMNPKILGKHPERLLCHIDRWLSSGHTYTVRFGIKMLMTYYLGENFKTEYAERVANVRSEEYYVKMMIAWYFATALSNNWDSILPFLDNRRLDSWTHNKTIQKAKESFRITAEQKEHLSKLKI